MKFRCQRNIDKAEGTQDFEVEAESEDEAREMFQAGKGELVETDCEVIDLSEYDLSSMWMESE